MAVQDPLHKIPWPLWQKILFRFFFVYLILDMAPWQFLGIIPGVNYILNYYDQLVEWAVVNANSNFFHVFGIAQVKRVYNGSSDTSFFWAEIYLYLWLAIIATIIWSITDRKKDNYQKLNYWFCSYLRFLVAYVCFTYGIDKYYCCKCLSQVKVS
jgi:hypothetical protein